MHNSLERYLEDLRESLKSLPEQEREMEIREVREHLEFLITQRIEQGESLDEATKTAVRQFGSPSDNGNDLKWAWRRKHNRASWQALKRNLRVLVGTRQGKPVVHWPGVIVFSALIAALNVLINVALSFALTHEFFFLSFSLAFGIPIQLWAVVYVNIKRGLQMSTDQLRSLD